MISIVEGIFLEYITHLIFIPAGYLILRLTKTSNPEVRPLVARGNLRLFFILLVLFLIIELASNFPGRSGSSMAAEFGGYLPLSIQLLFDGVVVGWTEEFLFRGCIQRTLNRRFCSLIASRIRMGTVMTAVIFGLFHFVNIGLGQSLNSIVPQVLFATFFGIIIGWFYDRTNDLAGAAWIHNFTDIVGTILPFLV